MNETKIIPVENYNDPSPNRGRYSQWSTRIYFSPKNEIVYITNWLGHDSQSIESYHGLTLNIGRINRADFCDIKPIIKYLESDRAQRLLRSITEEYDTKWDGSNTVGVLTMDGSMYLEELRTGVQELWPECSIYGTAREYYDEGYPEVEKLTEQNIPQTARDIICNVAKSGYIMEQYEVEKFLEEEMLEYQEQKKEREKEKEKERELQIEGRLTQQQLNAYIRSMPEFESYKLNAKQFLEWVEKARRIINQIETDEFCPEDLRTLKNCLRVLVLTNQDLAVTASILYSKIQ